MSHPPAACSGFEEDLSALLDHELGSEREAEVARHLDACAACRDRFAALARVDAGLRTLAPPPVPSLLEARVRARIAQESRAAVRRPSRAPRRRLRWLALPGAAAAAALAVALVRGLPWPARDRSAPVAAISDEELAIAVALHELPGLDRVEDLALVEQLELLEALDALDERG